MLIPDLQINTNRLFHHEHHPNVMFSTWVLFSSPVGIQFKKYTPWAHRIIDILDRMRSAGIYSKLLYYKYAKYPKPKARKHDTSGENLEALRIIHMTGSLLFLCAGLISNSFVS